MKLEDLEPLVHSEGGIAYEATLPNGYSILIRTAHSFSYVDDDDAYALTVLRNGGLFKTFDHLTESEVNSKLAEIEALPPASTTTLYPQQEQNHAKDIKRDFQKSC